MSLSISLTPEQAEQRFVKLGISSRFTEKEREQFTTTPVVVKQGGIFGFPTPIDNSALTLLEIKRIVGTDPSRQPCFFEHPWYADEAFMNTPCPPGWHFLHMDVLPESINRSTDYVRSLNVDGLELPAAVEVVLMLFLHFAGCGEQFLLKKHTWCADRASLDRIVTVGAFGRNGVFVSGHPAGFSSRGLGVCAKVLNVPPAGLEISG